MTSTWPRWLPRKSHLEKFKFTIFIGQVHFWCKCNRYKPVTFKIICQSSQGHLLSKESIDFLRHCSYLLGKVKGKSFKCKLTEFVSWDFRYFWFQCKVNGKFGIWSPMSSYMCVAKELGIEFLAPTYPFIETSNHSALPQKVTCFHMSAILN